MKANQRTIKVYDSTLVTLREIANRYGVSMAGLIDLLAQQIRNDKDFVLHIPSRPRKAKKLNVRGLVAKRGGE